MASALQGVQKQSAEQWIRAVRYMASTWDDAGWDQLEVWDLEKPCLTTETASSRRTSVLCGREGEAGSINQW